MQLVKKRKGSLPSGILVLNAVFLPLHSVRGERAVG